VGWSRTFNNMHLLSEHDLLSQVDTEYPGSPENSVQGEPEATILVLFPSCPGQPHFRNYSDASKGSSGFVLPTNSSQKASHRTDAEWCFTKTNEIDLPVTNTLTSTHGNALSCLMKPGSSKRGHLSSVIRLLL
jgi:hypothetical protein